MASVWIIERGDYSDYRVEGIFSTRDNAELVAAKLRESSTGNVDVTERILDPGLEALREGYRRFFVRMLRDGTVESIRLWEWELDDEPPYVWRRTSAPYNPGNKPDCLQSSVFARDEQHAIKIVNEQRAQLIARGEWS